VKTKRAFQTLITIVSYKLLTTESYFYVKMMQFNAAVTILRQAVTDRRVDINKKSVFYIFEL